MLQTSSQQPSTPPISETHVLKMLSRGAPINEILNELCNFIDFGRPGLIPTVLLPHHDGIISALQPARKFPRSGTKLPTV